MPNAECRMPNAEVFNVRKSKMPNASLRSAFAIRHSALTDSR